LVKSSSLRDIVGVLRRRDGVGGTSSARDIVGVLRRLASLIAGLA